MLFQGSQYFLLVQAWNKNKCMSIWNLALQAWEEMGLRKMCNWMSPLEVNLVSTALRLLTLQTTKNQNYYGHEILHLWKIFFALFSCASPNLYSFTLDLRRYISFAISQPTCMKTAEFEALNTQICYWVDLIGKPTKFKDYMDDWSWILTFFFTNVSRGSLPESIKPTI